MTTNPLREARRIHDMPKAERPTLDGQLALDVARLDVMQSVRDELNACALALMLSASDGNESIIAVIRQAQRDLRQRYAFETDPRGNAY